MLATFGVMGGSPSAVVGVEVCAYGAADGAQLWCTPQYNVSSPAAIAISTLADDGHLAFHMASVGLLAVDASAHSARGGDAAADAPTISLVYDSSANCCMATAVTVAGGVAVLSLPDGTRSGIWCNCQHSQLLGIEMPHTRRL